MATDNSKVDQIGSSKSSRLLDQKQCAHCGEHFHYPLFNDSDANKDTPFCCHGCKTVWNILHDKGLADYYRIRGEEKGAPVASISDSYAYLDQDEFKKDYLKEKANGNSSIEFYLEGVHCLACLWLIEKIPEFVPGVNSARLNLESSRATFSVSQDCPLSLLATEIARLGYKPHAIKRNDDVESFRKKEERTFLIRIGVAMACMGNISILSISNYGGADGHYQTIFNWISLVLSLPVVFYSAIPFYQNAWSALKRKVISIDLPVAIAVILGTVGGMVNLLRGVEEVYFDSLTSLVFLLLLGRYVMIKARQKGLDSSNLEYFNSFGSCQRKIPGSDKYEEVFAKYLNKGDLVKIQFGQIIPIDGEVKEGMALINTSLLTGESVPQTYRKGSHVFSGTEIVDGEILVEVDNVGGDTRVGKILERVEEGRKTRAPLVNLADRWSKYFVATVLSIATVMIVGAIIAGEAHEGVMRAISLIIVTCPCALALATPLALTRLMGMLGGQGIIVRSEDVIESLAKAKKIFLDKTGTLTKGKFQVVKWESDDTERTLLIANALEKKSKHPIALAIAEYCEQFNLDKIELVNWSEIPGVGVEGRFGDHIYRLHRNEESNSDQTAIVLKEDEKIIAQIFLEDTLRDDSLASIQLLKSMNVVPHILSGDNEKTVQKIAKELSISHNNIYSQLSPENKLSLVKDEEHSIMVGDGANDAMALDAASVGVAVKGSMDISLKAADVYLTSPGISKIVNLIEVSQETMSLIIRNLTFSVIYNIIGGILSVMGVISPLWAAVIMPLSSLTVLFSTIWGTKKIRKFARGIS